MAKSAVFEIATDEETTISAITFKAERIVEYEGKKQRFFLYKLVYSGYEDAYLAVAGPYSLDSKDLSSDNSATGLYFDDYIEGSNIDTLFKKYMQSFKQSENKDGGDELPPPPPPKSQLN